MPATLLDLPFHPDPYPLYAALRTAHPRGLHRDAPTAMWVASSAAAVEEVLQHPLLRVRPVDEPVPRALAGRPAGQVYGGLMRQNDGPVHTHGKAWAQPLLERSTALEPAIASLVAAGATPRHQALDTLMFEAPVRVLWQWLEGEPAGDAAPQVRALVAAWSALADEPTREAGHAAATALLQRLGGNANRVGLYTQTCEATAGVMGSVLVALQREPGLRAQWLQDPSLDDALALEAARHDPPVQNTRRYAAEPCTVRGHDLHAGDTLLVLLASANRDDTANPHAERFNLQRREARHFGWGLGRHACPGAALSRRIAMGLLRAWHEAGSPMEALTRHWHHRPSPNGRLPQFRPLDAHPPGARP